MKSRWMSRSVTKSDRIHPIVILPPYTTLVIRGILMLWITPQINFSFQSWYKAVKWISKLYGQKSYKTNCSTRWNKLWSCGIKTCAFSIQLTQILQVLTKITKTNRNGTTTKNAKSHNYARIFRIACGVCNAEACTKRTQSTRQISPEQCSWVISIVKVLIQDAGLWYHHFFQK